MNKFMEKKQGFTLVELSIVIIIIGFLIAGIAAGTSLIKQAGLTSLISEFANYQMLYNDFKLKYNAVPGDMRNASVFFPGCANTNINCNGDGNGNIDYNNNNDALGDATGDEAVRVFRHLYLSGLGTSAGILSLPDSYSDHAITTPQFPASKLGCCLYIVGPSQTSFQFGWMFLNMQSPWTKSGQNAIFLANANAFVIKGMLSPEDAVSIDKKIDDGNVGATVTGASTGFIRSRTDAGTANCEVGGVYDLTVKTKACILGKQLDE